MILYLKYGHVIDLGDVKYVRYDLGRDIPTSKYAKNGDEVFGLPDGLEEIEQIEFRGDDNTIFTCYADDIMAIKEDL